MSESDGIEWYEANAAAFVADYERLSFENVHDWLLDWLPDRPGLVLDVGAGSGRDAAWLAARGHEVVAVDASHQMLAEARRLHPDARIRWLGDRLPGLEATFRLGLSFDVILASAVWMHVASTQRPRAFRKLMTLLKPGGVLAMTLRHGPEVERAMHPVSVGGWHASTGRSSNDASRPRTAWAVRIFAGVSLSFACPTMEPVRCRCSGMSVLNDAKSSTYKLALLRAVARIADGAGGMARPVDDHVATPTIGHGGDCG